MVSHFRSWRVEHVRLQGCGHPPLCLLAIYSLTPLWYRVCSNTPLYTDHIPCSSTTFRNTSVQTVLYFHAKKVFFLTLSQTNPPPPPGGIDFPPQSEEFDELAFTLSLPGQICWVKCQKIRVNYLHGHLQEVCLLVINALAKLNKNLTCTSWSKKKYINLNSSPTWSSCCRE